jgi:hypothetical protein
MPQVSGAPEGLNKILESAYASALKEYKGDKAKASQVAWAAAKEKYEKVGGKWVLKKKEMSEEIEIDSFKEGDYPQGKFGPKELSEIQETYDPENYEAPILIGHLSDPSYKGKSAIPAFGWIGKVKVVGDHLKLVASQFSDELKEFIKKGLYKKVSAAFYDPEDASNPTPGKWHLHHLAFLGGTPPAVKGLEGIQFSAIGTPVEMAEFEAEVTVDGAAIDAAEEIGTDDTLTDIEESCATFIAKVQDALTGDIDADTQKSRCQLAASDLSSEIYSTLNMHWMFIEKLENIEEHQEAEMSEKKKTFKQKLIDFTANLINKKKETDMDAKLIKEYQDKIDALQAKVTQFEEAKAAEETAKLAAAQEAEKTAKANEVKTFCEQAIKENRMTPAMREKDEPLMLTLVDTPDALKSFQEKYEKPIVPLGEVNLTVEHKQDEKPKDVLSKAEKYIVDHPAEFSGMDHKQAIRKAILEKVK